MIIHGFKKIKAVHIHKRMCVCTITPMTILDILNIIKTTVNCNDYADMNVYFVNKFKLQTLEVLLCKSILIKFTLWHHLYSHMPSY